MTRVATCHQVSSLDQIPVLARRELRAGTGGRSDLALEVEEVGFGVCDDRSGWQKVDSAASQGRGNQSNGSSEGRRRAEEEEGWAARTARSSEQPAAPGRRPT